MLINIKNTDVNLNIIIVTHIIHVEGTKVNKKLISIRF